MSADLYRVVARVPDGCEEVARAQMLEVATEGFEESTGSGGLELTAYADQAGVARIRDRFPAATAAPVASGWENAWQAFHRPVVAGGIWIGPPWESPPAGPAVVIDPGRAFGTGAHPTTRLCVELLARLEHGSLLDIGCGSGVLAIAAVRLGFGPVTAIDLDPVAIEVTCANAKANGVTVDARIVDALAEPLPAADVVVANVLLAPVQVVLTRAKAGHVVASGYLAGERPEHDGWCHVECAILDGWAADHFRRATV